MGADVFPQPFPGVDVEINHFLDVHDVVFQQIHHVSGRGVVIVVVEGDGGVVHIPAPVLLPRQVVAQQAAVSLRGEDVVQPFEVGIVLLHPAHIAADADFARQLVVLDPEGHLVGDDLPAPVPVERMENG